MFKILFYQPLYNGLIWFLSVLPAGASLGWAVIALTLAVRILLAPLFYKSMKAQIFQKKIQPELTQIRKDYTDPQEQSAKIMELYKKHGSTPLAGCASILILLIQLPILFALYRVFLRNLTEINNDLLYASVQAPEALNLMFFGFDLSERSIVLAIVAGLLQFVQLQLSPAMRTPEPKPKVEGEEEEKPDMMAQMGTNMQKQMKYMLPIIIVVIGLTLPSAIAIYLIVSAVFTTFQEYFIGKQLEEKTV